VFILLNFPILIIQNIANIPIKILNLFLFNYITKKDTKTKFKNVIKIL